MKLNTIIRSIVTIDKLKKVGAKHIVGSLWEHEEAHSFYAGDRIERVYQLIGWGGSSANHLMSFINDKRAQWVAYPLEVERMRKEGLI